MPRIELLTTAYQPGQFPDLNLPQVAFAGRSNVGKSSLINCLAGRKKLAQISSTPGKTRSINFYWVPVEELYLVDLPGYGYAKRSKQERQHWAKLSTAYFHNNAGLRAVVVLLDARLSPQRLDLELVGFLREQSILLIAVLTKVDKCKNRQLNQVHRQWIQILGSSTAMLAFSAKSGQGKQDLWTGLKEIAGKSSAAEERDGY